MWTFYQENLSNKKGIKFSIERNSQTITFDEFIAALQKDEKFRSKFNATLADLPYSAFRWETPSLSVKTKMESFEFVVLEDPSLIRQTDTYTFLDFFNKNPSQTVLDFPNLGRDAILVVPKQIIYSSAYGHLAAFVRNAPGYQQQDFWELVGEVVSKRLNTKSVWLNTAGDGVSWLHVRLDDRPKYYAFAPYRQRT